MQVCTYIDSNSAPILYDQGPFALKCIMCIVNALFKIAILRICEITYTKIAAPIVVAILGPNALSSSPPHVIPTPVNTDPTEFTHIASTLRKLVSSVRLRRYDMMYGAKFPAEKE